jgi:ABC-type Co2+ transport system permease subunit
MDIFTAFGLSASAGLNAYIPLLVVALLSKFTNMINLSPPWDTLENWWVIGLLVFLSGVEFFADKFPAVNHANDMIQTVIRPIAGAYLFAASAKIITDVHPVLAMIMGLLVAGTVHTVKALAIRPAVTATTGGAGNVPVSIAEDIVATILTIIAAVIPVLIAVMLVMGGALVVWWIWRRINRERASI